MSSFAPYIFDSGPVQVGTTDTIIATIQLPFLGERTPIICVQLDNQGAEALKSLKVQAQSHPGGDWFDYLSDDDFANANLVDMWFATTNLWTAANPVPKGLPNGQAGNVHFVCRGSAIRFVATTNSNTTLIQARGILRRGA